MAEKSDPQAASSPPPEDFHWGVAYLREDIQDVRREIQDVRQEMRQEFQNVRQEMRQEIQSVHSRIDETNKRIDETGKYLSQRIDSRFGLLLMAMIAMTGILLTAIKL